MLLRSSTPSQTRLHNARRIFSLVPVMVFLVTVMLLARPTEHSYVEFSHVLFQAIAASLASCLVSIAAYGFYRYLLDRSSGL